MIRCLLLSGSGSSLGCYHKFVHCILLLLLHIARQIAMRKDDPERGLENEDEGKQAEERKSLINKRHPFILN